MSTQKEIKTPNPKGEKSGNITAYSKSKLSGKPICRKTIKPITQQLKVNGKTIEESLLDLPRFTLYFILHSKVIQEYLDLFAINSGCAPLTVDDVRKVIADNRLGEVGRKYYHCHKCNILVESASQPSALGCPSQSSHQWHYLGQLGDKNYQCRKCGTYVHTESQPSSLGCGAGGSHQWHKL